MATYNLGRILPVFKGTYSATTQYHKMDVVLYSGSSYVAKQDVKNLSPSTASSRKPYWQQIALKGQLSGEIDEATQQVIINAILSNSNIVLDGDYVHSDNNYTDEYKQKLDNLEVNDGVVTIKKNGTAVGSFSVNQMQNTYIDLAIPTNVGELMGIDNYTTNDSSFTYSTNNVVIQYIKPSSLHYCSQPIDTLNVVNYELIDINDPTTWVYPVANIIFETSASGANITMPTGTYFTGANVEELEEGVLQANNRYMLRLKGGICEVLRLR